MGFKLYLFGLSLAVLLTKEHDDGGEIVDDHGDIELADSDEPIPMGFAPSK